MLEHPAVCGRPRGGQVGLDARLGQFQRAPLVDGVALAGGRRSGTGPRSLGLSLLILDVLALKSSRHDPSMLEKWTGRATSSVPFA